MKLAYFSPLPPKRTGIATYSRHLIPALSQRLNLDLFDYGEVRWPDRPVLDYLTYPHYVLQLKDYDVVLYQMGNNRDYHLPIYWTLQIHPGVVVLHDAVLYDLVAGQGIGGLVKEFCLNYGAGRLTECLKNVENPTPERYHMLRLTLEYAQALIVHSETTRQRVIELGYSRPAHVIPHLFYPDIVTYASQEYPMKIRADLGITPDEFLIGSFGFIVFTKRMESVLAAVGRLKDRFPLKLLIVGEGEDLTEAIKAQRLQKYVIQTGFVEDTAFNRYLAAIDILVNLRYPSMGETSGNVIQAMSYGKACIVTNHAWLSELPDDCVCKIGYGPTEIDELEQALRELCGQATIREAMGNAARCYVEEHCQPEQVADHYVKALEAVVSGKEQTKESVQQHISNHFSKAATLYPVTSSEGEVFPAGWAERYFVERARQAVRF